MNSQYSNNFLKTVINASESKIWETAVKEWEIKDCEEDESCLSVCICGKENIRYLYTIYNIKTQKTLFPIGSSCIRKFRRTDFNDEIKMKEDMFKLLRSIKKGERIELNSDFFSKRVLERLYKEDAFINTQYNHYDGSNDYEFMLKMYNKRDKSSITEAQNRKISAIIMNSIKPYLMKTLKIKAGNK